MHRVYYQGIPGSFSSIAAKAYFGKKPVTLSGLKDFAEIFARVTKEKGAWGVLPIENTIAGSIHENYDLLYQNSVYIVGEISIHIEHNLLALPGAKLNTIHKVYSHYKALEQCQQFFNAHPHIEEIVYFDTAGSAQYVAQAQNPTIAAIASKEAAALYRLTILKPNIEDNPSNLTRFIVISAQENRKTRNQNKCSLLFTTTHTPHSLQLVLTILANANCNLTKIESRPLIGRPFEYLFYVDFEFETLTREKVEQTLAILKVQQPYFKNLGFYQSYK